MAGTAGELGLARRMGTSNIIALCTATQSSLRNSLISILRGPPQSVPSIPNTYHVTINSKSSLAPEIVR
jgi:hypothetical protein